MDLKKYVFENLEKDIINKIYDSKKEKNIIHKIYCNDMEELQHMNKTKEYVEVTSRIRKMERKLFQEFSKENVEKYIEYTNQKISIEAESQFELGFKTVIKIILQALK